ncbi:MAG TPA: hypothetical protein VFX03_04840, partial [Thermomicrobiales bacterium]|nr:hypothetical protein [Thermomicrobiales bacterium]
RRALWIYPWDILDAGIDATVHRAGHEWRLSALSLTASYHSAKFLLPRRSREKVFLSGGAAVYFRPDPALYADTPLKPVVTPRADLLDVLDRTSEACRRQGLGLRAWTVALHNSRLGEAQPEAAEVNAFGDRYPWALCPANPDVRRYAAGLVRDVATNHDVDWIDLESIGYHGLYHGHHHELIGIEFGPLDEFLMGLCFCRHCLARAGEAGIDGERLRAEVAATLERRFADEAFVPALPMDDPKDVLSLLTARGDLAAYVRMRLQTVATLVGELATTALAGSRTRLALTASTFQRGAENAWLEGMDLRLLAQAADEIIVLAYAQDPGEIAADIRFARDLAGGMERL